MTSPELLRFFQSEASEYLDAMQAQVEDAGGTPDAPALIAAARALRGSATMARAPRVAEIALGLERLGNALRDGESEWSEALRDGVRATLADLRVLVPAAPAWGPTDDERATASLTRLRRLVPNDAPRPVTPAPGNTAPIFIALQASAIAGDLERFASDPGDRQRLEDLVTRLRGLRGIAGIVDHPPLAEVADAVERVLRALAPDAVLLPTDIEVCAAAAAVFRRASADLRSRGRFDPSADELTRFARATADAQPADATATPVVLIDELFYGDGGTTIVRRGEPPRERRDTRFHDEIVSLAEHLQRLVAEGRAALDVFSRERARRQLHDHLRTMEGVARSFGADQIAAFLADVATEDLLADSVLDVLDRGAGIVGAPARSVADMERELAVIERGHRTPAAGTPVVGHAATGRGVRGGELRESLAQSLAGLELLEQEPLSEPAPLDDDSIVPIESLLYRGRAALERARELRDRLRERGAADPNTLQELYDLLDLARTE